MDRAARDVVRVEIGVRPYAIKTSKAVAVLPLQGTAFLPVNFFAHRLDCPDQRGSGDLAIALPIGAFRPWWPPRVSAPHVGAGEHDRAIAHDGLAERSVGSVCDGEKRA